VLEGWGRLGRVKGAAQFQGDEGDNCWPLASSQGGRHLAVNIYICSSAARARRLHCARGARGPRSPCGPDASDSRRPSDRPGLETSGLALLNSDWTSQGSKTWIRDRPHLYDVLK